RHARRPPNRAPGPTGWQSFWHAAASRRTPHRVRRHLAAPLGPRPEPFLFHPRVPRGPPYPVPGPDWKRSARGGSISVSWLHTKSSEGFWYDETSFTRCTPFLGSDLAHAPTPCFTGGS